MENRIHEYSTIAAKKFRKNVRVAGAASGPVIFTITVIVKMLFYGYEPVDVGTYVLGCVLISVPILIIAELARYAFKNQRILEKSERISEKKSDSASTDDVAWYLKAINTPVAAGIIGIAAFNFLVSDYISFPTIGAVGTPAAANPIADTKLTKCINLAMDNGYGDEHCARMFLDTCTTTTSRSELNKVYSFDMSGLGYGTSTMCGPRGNPNGQRYSNAWQKVFAVRDRF